MANITASMVKELRERTQAGMSDCKSALVEADGDMDKAVEVLLKKGTVKAASRSGRVATEGEVRTWISKDAKKGVIVEINCQTDFVARGDDFKNFVSGVLEVASTAKKGADLSGEKFPGTDKTVDQARTEFIARSGENTVIRRWDTLEAKGPGGIIHAYIHMGGKLAVLVDAEAPHAHVEHTGFRGFVDNVAMQIAAMNPFVVHKDHVDPAQLSKQKEIYAAQLKEEGKPEASHAKIIEGKVNKWFTEVTLLGQESVIDNGKTVDAIRQNLAKELGGDVHIHAFVRYGLGEGIEKVKEDLMSEVMKTIGA